MLFRKYMQVTSMFPTYHLQLQTRERTEGHRAASVGLDKKLAAG